MTPRALLIGLFLLVGCRSPDPRLYTMVAHAGATSPSAPRIVEVRRPAIASYLDRPQIVRGVDGQRLEVSDGDQWAEPLAEMLGRVLAENLALRLPDSEVFTEVSALSADSDVRVEVDLQRFEQQSDGQVALVAVVALRYGSGARDVVLERITLAADREGSGTDALVRTLADLVAQLADRLAGALSRLPPSDA